MTGRQYLEGLVCLMFMKSLNSGIVVAFIVPSFLLSFGRLLDRGRERDTGSLFSCLQLYHKWIENATYLSCKQVEDLPETLRVRWQV